MDGVNALGSPAKAEALGGGGSLGGVLQILYESIAELNVQLPEKQRMEKSSDVVLLGAGGKLDSLSLVNFIVITEQKLEEFFGFRVDLTQDDPFSPTSGHFGTVNSLATYIAELAEKKKLGTAS
jgi:acyl carrier protein